MHEAFSRMLPRMLILSLLVGLTMSAASCSEEPTRGAAKSAGAQSKTDPIPVAKAPADDSKSSPQQTDSLDATTSLKSAATSETAGDWSEFLGPHQNGISDETGLLEKWPAAGPRVLWKLKIGEGYSAPSIRGNRLVLFHRPSQKTSSGDVEVVECLAADTGKPIWRYGYPTQYVDPYGYNGGPRCTPLITADRCYTFGAEGVLTCLNLDDGEKVWQRKTAEEFNIPFAFFGVGATPILEGNLLIVMVGGHPKSGVVAFDAKTGKTVWESVGPETWPPPRVRIQRDRPPAKLASYAAPLPATIHGKRHLLCFMRPGLVSLDPATGKTNFSFWFRSELHDSVNAARPVVIDDYIFLSAAYETGAALLKVHPDGKDYDLVWKDVDAMQTHWSTTIADRGYLYGFSGRHQAGSSFRCIDLKTGKLKWQTHDVDANEEPDPKEGRGKTPPKYYGRGSATLAEDKFIVQGESGVLALVECNPEKFVEISRVNYPESGYPSWVAPVVAHKRLYLNVAREVPDAFGRMTHLYHLLCLDLAKP
jgi:outer membrane protein assembly factor BamB